MIINLLGIACAFLAFQRLYKAEYEITHLKQKLRDCVDAERSTWVQQVQTMVMSCCENINNVRVRHEKIKGADTFYIGFTVNRRYIKNLKE